MKNFAIIGVGGYVAPRHLKAIHETGNNLIAAYDTCDSVGILDSYFPATSFFTEMELFDRHCTKAQNRGEQLDYVSVCTPNYLHDAHTRYALRLGADVICEKPLVLNPWNLDGLQQTEEQTGHKVNNILQLRLHPSIVALKEKIDNGPQDKVYDIDLTYITSRGYWYYASWKGDARKSGGIATNIGIHFLDMLLYLFGEMEQSTVHVSTHDRVAGFLQLKRARVRYFLSINAHTLPQDAVRQGLRTYRSITIGNEAFEFSGGFTELHTESYRKILDGHGFGIAEARPCIELAYDIRNAQPVGLKGDYHPLAALDTEAHPFGWQ
ncbi:MAG: Gfo/Idh/MocA family oxidoreductase [Bacteroidales bacterium]|nr:Gfo/Idh/MocA family oxidoreductase [Bacteroidales bacterium]